MNDVKRRFSLDYLTPSQQLVLDTLCLWVRTPEWTNLCGPHGTGKTFVAWAVARATGATYVPVPSALETLGLDPEVLIVDNAPYQEPEVRRVLSKCGLLNCYSVVLVTQQAVTMPMRRVELLLPTREETEMAAKTLARLSYVCNMSMLPDEPTYWDIIATCV